MPFLDWELLFEAALAVANVGSEFERDVVLFAKSAYLAPSSANAFAREVVLVDQPAHEGFDVTWGVDTFLQLVRLDELVPATVPELIVFLSPGGVSERGRQVHDLDVFVEAGIDGKLLCVMM